MRVVWIAAAFCGAALPAIAGPVAPIGGAPYLSRPIGVSNQQYQYVATFASPVRIEGVVNAGGIVWKCGGNQCFTSGPWPTPGVSSCNALAMQEGYATSYGYSAAQLNPDQLAVCNQGVANNAKPSYQSSPSNYPKQKGKGYKPDNGYSSPSNYPSYDQKPSGMAPPNDGMTPSYKTPSGMTPSDDMSSGMTPPSKTPPSKTPPSKTPPGMMMGASSGPPYTIRTVTFDVSGTGVLAPLAPFSLLNIRTAPFEVSGAPVAASTFSPMNIRTQPFAVSGTGSP